MKISTANVLPQAARTAKSQTNAGAKPDPNVFTKEELQSLRDQVRQNVRAQIARATEGAAAQGVPAPPAPPGPITIRGSDGKETYISLPPGFSSKDVIPPQAVDISIAFFLTMAFIIVGLPLARAFARRMDRRSGPTQIPGEISAQLTQLNQAVDAIALEVERISEGQRFTTRLLSEQRDAARQTLQSGSER